jgi:cytoskeletal protein RodZ
LQKGWEQMAGKTLWLMVMAALILAGCDKPQTAEAPAPVKETASAQTVVADEATAVVEQAAVTAVAEAVPQEVAPAQQLAEPGEVAAAPVETAVAEVQQLAEPVIAEAQQAAAAAVEQVQTTAAAVVAAGQQTVTEVAEAAVAAVSPAPVSAPEILVLENNYGAVSFTHAWHGQQLGCTTCHGEATPGPFELGKDRGHALCKECHAAQKQGPTKCGDCHKK